VVELTPELLHSVHHSEENTQIDFLPIKMRETFVRQWVNIINVTRGSFKALGIRIPNATNRGFAKQAQFYLEKNHLELLPSISPMIQSLIFIKEQIAAYNKAIDNLNPAWACQPKRCRLTLKRKSITRQTFSWKSAHTISDSVWTIYIFVYVENVPAFQSYLVIRVSDAWTIR